MKMPSFEEEADEFLNVITSVERFGGRADVLPVLQLLFAMRAAYWIRKTLPSSTVAEAQFFGEELLDRTETPPYEVMYERYRRLLAAYRSKDNVALAPALREMRILEFCPSLDDQFARMEQLTQQVEAPARLILHVELALFAFELGDESAVKHHTQEAWVLNPTGWERYILCTLQGFYEACSGDIQGATRWLEESISACFEDENTLIRCGVRPPNLHLAQKVLSQGQRIPVLDYLLACQDVWRTKGMPFGEWIQQIELGQEPDFEASETIRGLGRPFLRLNLQSLRAYNSLTAQVPGSPLHAKKSRADVLLAREKRLAESKRTLDRITQERISNSGKSGLEPEM